MAIELDDYQLDAVSRMKNGSVLVGDVGSGKSRTGIAYYFVQNGGCVNPYEPMRPVPQDLYIITTAKKRDSGEWLGDLAPFCLSTDKKACLYPCNVVIDSWNNIKKYTTVENAFFIFDEQRVVGYGAWTKAFLKIVRENDWILLTATPGDNWLDYMPLFIAHGYYKNKRDFEWQHVIYNPSTKFKQVQRYLEQGRLIRYRNSILIDMDYQSAAERQDIRIVCDHDRMKYRMITKDRWNPYDNVPIENVSQFNYLLRKSVNSDRTRVEHLNELLRIHPRIIVFYNFDYELEAIKNTAWPKDVTIAEWNGHNHEPIPDSERWLYLVQYTAGAEGWNCTKTDTIVFFSQTYSYKTLMQAKGRIDRRNSPYKTLYYYHFRSHASIDTMIARSLANKKDFNIRRLYYKKTTGGRSG